MSTNAVAATERLDIVISDDRTQAWLCAAKAAEPLTEAEILAALETKKIAITEDVRACVEQYLRQASSAGEPDEANAQSHPTGVLIAQGRSPAEANDGTFVWSDQFQANLRDWKGEDSVNYYEMCSILTVEADTVIGRIVEPVDGKPGLDVFGREIPPRRSRGVPLELADGLRFSSGSQQEVMTCSAGRVVIRRGQMHLDELLTINGDVDFDSGSLDVCAEVLVTGTVRANFSVRTTKSLTVGGAIEAADVHVDGDVVVHGGVLGREQLGKVRAGGQVTARYCEEATIRAEGDVKICRELIHTELRTNGRVLAQVGAIIACDVHGREGIEVRELGNEAGVHTQVSVGAHRELLARIRKIADDIKLRNTLAERIRARAEPLMANVNGLTDEQRNQITELLDKAEELEGSLDELQREHDELVDRGQPRGRPCVIVNKTIYPGVRIALGPRETFFDRSVSGPVQIEQRKVRGATEIVALNLASGSVTVLPSTEIDLSRVAISDE